MHLGEAFRTCCIKCLHTQIHVFTGWQLGTIDAMMVRKVEVLVNEG